MICSPAQCHGANVRINVPTNNFFSDNPVSVGPGRFGTPVQPTAGNKIQAAGTSLAGEISIDKGRRFRSPLVFVWRSTGALLFVHYAPPKNNKVLVPALGFGIALFPVGTFGFHFDLFF